MSVKQCEDYISDLICDDDQRYLVASSGEGTITSFSLRSRTVHTQVSRGERAKGGTGRMGKRELDWCDCIGISITFC